jgi:hypothetical protein
MIYGLISFLSLAFLASLSILTVPGVSASECYEKAPLRPVHRTYLRRDVLEPGVYAVSRVPSLYGWRKRRVISHPVTWHEEPAIYKTVSSTVRVRGGWTWEMRDVKGKDILCKVRLPDRYETVERKVLVKPARRWASRPQYSTVHERVLLRPYKNLAHYYRPHVHFARERAYIQPEEYRWLPTSLRPDC